MMKRHLTRALVSCAALAVIGGTLIAPTLAAERRSTASADIGETQAKTLALDQAGLTADQVRWLRVERDYEDGRLEYEVEFSAGDWTYQVDLTAADGAVTGYDRNWKGWGSAQADTDIGAEQAQALALKHAGVDEADTAFVYSKADYEDGLRVYDVEFYADGREYDYEIDAADGTILSFDYDVEWYEGPASAASADRLTEAQVKEIVERTAGTTGVYTEFKLDMDDGRLLYEGELRSGRMEYEFEIDALTGAVVDWDADWD